MNCPGDKRGGRTERLFVDLHPGSVDRLGAAARAAGVSLTVFVRQVLEAVSQGAPEAKPTGGAERLGKITSSVSAPGAGKGSTDGK